MFLPQLLGQPDSKQDAINVWFHCPRSQGKNSFVNCRCCKIAGIFAIGSGPLERASERERERERKREREREGERMITIQNSQFAHSCKVMVSRANAIKLVQFIINL
jgi:hypothetical protein